MLSSVDLLAESQDILVSYKHLNQGLGPLLLSLYSSCTLFIICEIFYLQYIYRRPNMVSMILISGSHGLESLLTLYILACLSEDTFQALTEVIEANMYAFYTFPSQA